MILGTVCFAVITLCAVVLLAPHMNRIVGLFDSELERDLLHDDYMDNAARRGLSYQETMDEWDVRTEFARIRREATNLVLIDVARWQEIIEKKIGEAYKRLAIDRPNLIPHFRAMVAGLPYNHILYPEAARLVDNWTRQEFLRGSTVPISDEEREDRLAAIRIVSPY